MAKTKKRFVCSVCGEPGKRGLCQVLTPSHDYEFDGRMTQCGGEMEERRSGETLLDSSERRGVCDGFVKPSVFTVLEGGKK